MGGQGVFQWLEFVEEQITHQQSVEIGEYINVFFARTFENWQSEFLQLFSMVFLTSFLVHKGSAESKDSDEKVKKSLERIEKKLSIKNN